MQTSPTTTTGTAPHGGGTDLASARPAMTRREDGWIVPCESAHCAKIRFNPDQTVDIGSTKHDNILTFTWDEWTTFAAGITGGHVKLAE